MVCHNPLWYVYNCVYNYVYRLESAGKEFGDETKFLGKNIVRWKKCLSKYMDSDRVCDDSFYPAGSSIPYAGLSKAYVLQAEGVFVGTAGRRCGRTFYTDG